jgi:DNA-binding NarL/FixJ family response regulator
VARRLRDRLSRAKILFLSIHEDVEFVTAGFDIGACGYVFKSRVVEDLRKAIEIVYACGRFVSPTSLRSGHSDFYKPSGDPASFLLTNPQKELRPHSSVCQAERMRFLLLLDRALSDYLPDMT